ncbi:unnamed protein product [Durusdinium trenchii]|uniref:Uncharacterized protein n=1 Tax=Durusdinium trenchii TaxID=1381693 RepID=A0ABP0KFA4_9DINO
MAWHPTPVWCPDTLAPPLAPPLALALPGALGGPVMMAPAAPWPMPPMMPVPMGPMAGEAMMELEAPNLQMLPMPMPAPGLSCGDLHNAMSAASCATNACGGFVPLAARQVSPGLWCVLLSDPQLQAAQEIQELPALQPPEGTRSLCLAEHLEPILESPPATPKRRTMPKPEEMPTPSPVSFRTLRAKEELNQLSCTKGLEGLRLESLDQKSGAQAWLDAEQHLPIGSPEKAEPQVAWSAPKSSQSAGWAAAAGWAAETAVHRCQAQKAALEQDRQVEHAGAHAELSPQRATSAQPRHWERHAWQSWEVQTPSQTPCPARKKKSWKKSQTATVKMFRSWDEGCSGRDWSFSCKRRGRGGRHAAACFTSSNGYKWSTVLICSRLCVSDNMILRFSSKSQVLQPLCCPL